MARNPLLGMPDNAMEIKDVSIDFAADVRSPVDRL